MKPYYEHAGITIYNGDCRDIFSSVQADACLCDPPYGISHSSSHGASWSGTNIAGDHSTEVRDYAWNYFDDAPKAMFGISWKQPPPRGVRAVLIWDKGPAFGAGDLRMPWKPSWEEIYIGGDGWEGRRDEGVLRGPCVVSWESKGRVHPHQKPEWIFVKLIQKLPRAKTICDPFMGSGTTGIACIRTKRRFIGIEIDEGHCETAAKRIERELAQGVFAF